MLAFFAVWHGADAEMFFGVVEVCNIFNDGSVLAP